MNKNIVTLLIVGALALTSFSYLYLDSQPVPVDIVSLSSHSEVQSEDIPSQRSSISEADKPAVEDFVSKQDKIFLEKLERSHPLPEFEDTVTSASLDASFQRMHSMGNYFNADHLQRQELSQLLEAHNTLDVAKQIILNPSYAQTEFGENQGLARVYAIRLLAQQAKEGDPSELYLTTSDLAGQLNTTLESGKNIERGRQYDLEKLLRIMVKEKDISEFTDPNVLINFLYEAGFEDGFNQQIVNYYDDAVFFPLLNEYGRERASYYVSSAIDRLTVKQNI